MQLNTVTFPSAEACVVTIQQNLPSGEACVETCAVTAVVVEELSKLPHLGAVLRAVLQLREEYAQDFVLDNSWRG
jgi:hypothetical protein